LAGEGRRVSKRIYKFKWLKPITQTFNNEVTPNKS
jgi:hypothetical protein